ncbi:MAG: transporter substrate-binding domain-containing protein [Rhodocyclaceae bacterium]|jgi:polar amino acid transport system substrate-binding protein|nr:transporter substrate-binding domain-containing protein [Rhodocyclaceae bacterium]MBK6905836.1 transporter substrate-binding domain-containing protein [Rhodocyclaceae bacterium]
MTRRIIFSLLGAVSIAASGSAFADKVVIAGDFWCPFNCDPKGANPGYMVEIAKLTLGKAGHTVDYQIKPWARAIDDARSGAISGVIGAVVDDVPDFVFPKAELGAVSDAAFVLNSSNWVYKDMGSLEQVSIGVINGYAYSTKELNDYIKKNAKNSKRVQFANGDNAQEMSVNKLVGKRMDVIIEAPAVFWYTVNQMKMQDKVKAAGVLSKPANTYIAFSPKNPKSKDYAQLLSDGIDDLRKSGELKVILKKYGLEDWK